jgi:DNA repair protein SbcC/Rad50
LRLAIAEWVARERGADIGLLVLDEVFGSQDEERRRLLMEQLRNLSARFRQVLIITHVPEIAELCDARIEVSMDDARRSSALVSA